MYALAGKVITSILLAVLGPIPHSNGLWNVTGYRGTTVFVATKYFHGKTNADAYRINEQFQYATLCKSIPFACNVQFVEKKGHRS